MTAIRAFEIDGHKIRLYRRDQTAAELALWASDFPGMTLMEVAQKLAESSGLSTAAAYLRLERLFPFEIDAVAFGLDAHKRIEYLPGQRLDDWRAPDRAPKSKDASIDTAVDAKLRELEGWVNVFALREEAWRYMQGIENRLTKRIEALEEKAQ